MPGISGDTSAVPDTNWQVAGVSDFDGQGRSGGTVATGISDLLWRISTHGSLPMPADANWQIVTKGARDTGKTAGKWCSLAV